jgi:hypothetical protein
LYYLARKSRFKIRRRWVESLGACCCFHLPEESLEEEATIASLLMAFVRSPEGAEGMAMLASRGPRIPRRIFIFPGSNPLVQEVVDALVRKHGGASCEPPAAGETMFLVGSVAVWNRLQGTKPSGQRPAQQDLSSDGG